MSNTSRAAPDEHAGPRRTLEVSCCLGPFFSHGGLKNWHLHLCPGEVVAVPLGIWLSVKAGFLAGIGGLADGAYRQHPRHLEPSALVDEGHPGWRRYPLSTIEHVMVRRCATANEILIKALDGPPHMYGIGHRAYTDTCRSVFAQLYERQYREEGFGRSWRQE